MSLSTSAFLLVVVSAALAIDVPDFIHVCKRSDPNIEACITESVEKLRPYLKTGVPEYNIPSLEPLLLNELVASEGSGLRITAKNVHAYGASDFIVRRLKIDLDHLRFAVDVDLPHLYIDGQYSIDGRVLLLPIRGSGPLYGNFSAATGAVKLKGELRKDKEGLDHLHFEEFRMKISIGKGSLRLENLFGGERALGDVVNGAINSNFDSFIKELQPLIEHALSEAFVEISNRIVNPFTYEQLFPEH
ncbi:circadian clock-controlled protein [Orussus abietinus]|uniref:circadian clock-controlled protein n=1 Tax=Orussus abietinus TaxID=222816 RepID=UPI000625E5B5|nr:circadian clock-controlled protein [Orussus abietinus]